MEKKEHLLWADTLRVVACFLVVLAHSCDPFVARFDSNPFEFLSGVFIGSAVRPCVPLFVMMSAVLLLPVTMDTSRFYRRRMSRVIYPLIFWGIVSPILYYVYFHSGLLQTNLLPENYTASATINKILMLPFNFNYDTTPLWYLYMLIGIYLFLPVISPWLEKASKKDLRRFLMIWLVATLIPYIGWAAPLLGYAGNYGNMGLLGVCDWNLYGTFYYFSGFLGYVVLAWYLVRFPLQWSWTKLLSVSVPLYLLGYVITSVGFLSIQKIYPGQFAYLEIIWLFCGFNVLLMTFPCFVLFQKLRTGKGVQRFMAFVAPLTFGIYLCHFLLVQINYDFIYNYLALPPYLQIVLIAVCTFALSGAVVWCLRKLPMSRYLVG